MTIELITKEEHQKLMDIQKNYPALTFQNEGYEYLNMSKLTEEEKEKFKEVEEILEKSIRGFSKLNNFKLSKKTEEVQLRFQYNWTADEENPRTSFTGVGYILVDELLNGFRDNEVKV